MWWLVVSGALATPGERVALLVGIDAYGVAPGVSSSEQWTPLEGSGNDVTAMQTALEAEGFQVAVLRDDEATHDGILEAFDRELLERVSSPDDVALFYFSGHGQQVTDLSGDEFDGWDESLVPWDNRGTEDGTGNLLDDELHQLLGQLSGKTSNVVFIVDSCFAGSGSRGAANTLARARGEGPPRQPPAASKRGTQDGSAADGVDDATGYVFLAASASHERAWEVKDASGEWVGGFTSALVSSLQHLPPGATYRTWVELSRAALEGEAQRQHPQIDGDADRKVFETEWGSSGRHYAWNLRDGRVRVEAGSMHGIGKDSVFGLYPPGQGALEAREAPVRAPVTELFPAWSYVDVEGVEPGTGGRALEVESTVALTGMAVHVERIPRVARALEGLPVVSLVEPDSATLTIKRVGDRVEIRYLDGAPVRFPTREHQPMESSARFDDPNLPARVVEALSLEVKGKRIRALRNEVPQSWLPVTLQAELVNVVNPRREEGRLVDDGLTVLRQLGTEGETPVRPGEHVRFTVHNGALRDLYMALLEVSTDGSTQVVWPSSAYGSENLVRAGSSAVLQNYAEMKAPTGRQTWKLVGATEDIDFSVLQQKAVSRGHTHARGAQTLLGQLVAEALAPTRGVVRVPTTEMYWGTDQVDVQIGEDR